MATVEDIFQGHGNDVHVIVGIGTARYGETQQVEAAETVLAGHGVAVGEDITDLAAAYAGFKIELYGESLCREFLFRNLGENL